MRIVFMGSPDFAIPSLEALHNSRHNILAVISNADKRRGRGSKKMPTPVKAKAMDMGLPVINAESLNDPALEKQLADLNPDLFVVVAFRVLPPALLEIPQKGSINLHASLLPRYRGAAPIHWAVMNGETETGCSVFFLEEKVDTGGILLQQKTPIGENETTGDVYNRLKEMGSKLLTRAVDQIQSDEYQIIPQDHSLATPAPKLFPEDCKVNFKASAKRIHNKIRGLSPFPTAWATLDALKFQMYRSRIGPAADMSLKPGQLLMKEDKLLAGCADGSIILDEVQIEGKRRMSGREFMNGYAGLGILH